MGLEEVSVCKISEAINQAKLHNFYILTDVIYIKEVSTFWHLYFNIMASNPLEHSKVPNFFLYYKGFKQDTPCSGEAEPFASPLPLFNSAAAVDIRAQGEGNSAMSEIKQAD